MTVWLQLAAVVTVVTAAAARATQLRLLEGEQLLKEQNIAVLEQRLRGKDSKVRTTDDGKKYS